jgi:integrase
LLKPLIILALETSMRRGELLGLRWEHIDFERRVAHLPLTKNGDSRDVPLSLRATGALQSLISATRRHPDRVFPMTGNAVRLAFERLRERVGMNDFHFHDLRHEAVSRLFEKGLNVVEVSTISGHKELRMLQRYTHLRAADLVARLG